MLLRKVMVLSRAVRRSKVLSEKTGAFFDGEEELLLW